MAEFRHFCNVLERSDENKWCPEDSLNRLFIYLFQILFLRSESCDTFAGTLLFIRLLTCGSVRQHRQ